MVKVKKVYPIKGRRDFFKYVVMDNGEIAKGCQGNKWDVPMYFNDKADADKVAEARRRVKKLTSGLVEAQRNYRYLLRRK